MISRYHRRNADQLGATYAFGIVGDGINPVIEALRKRREQIRYIPVRHEEAAAFMASGFAKHTWMQMRG